ncbi:MAG: CCA tRNA nucleotidyltransferase [Verrucomicrobia bacterium]|nr:CCA tRNA nucleotidyltransferase [Verrucomicrobiota bacterium]
MSASPSPLESSARRVVVRLREAGFVAYYAGGCVRDMTLGKTPKDYDVATSATPEQVQSLFPRHVAVGAHFGVIMVLEDGHPFEVASFRADGVYIDGRRPASVRFTTAEEDAARRDFTINGMFFDPLARDGAGELIDFVGGRADLAAGVVRAIGKAEARFAEDRLRLLRAVRFGAVLGFRIEDETWTALRAAAPEIHAVSPERIREELVRIFTHPTRVAGWDLLDASGLMAEVLPELTALKGVEQPPQFHPEGDVFVHTRLVLSHLPPEPVSVALAFGTLLHDIGKPPTMRIDHADGGRIRFNGHEHVGAEMAERVMRRLRFSNDETEAVVELVRNHMVFKDVQKMRVAKVKRFLARPWMDDELLLHRADCLGSHAMLDNYDFLRAKREEFAHAPLIPEPLLTGHDFIALGWKPGPRFKEVLEAALNRQLEGGFANREEALEWAKTCEEKTA